MDEGGAGGAVDLASAVKKNSGSSVDKRQPVRAPNRRSDTKMRILRTVCRLHRPCLNRQGRPTKTTHLYAQTGSAVVRGAVNAP